MSAIFPPHRKIDALAGTHHLINFDAASACHAALRDHALQFTGIVAGTYDEEESFPGIAHWLRSRRRPQQAKVPERKLRPAPVFAALR
jgi:hypothetical protein